MKVIFILVDALKSLYLDNKNMPFLSFISRDSLYVQKIVPSPGFCERSEIFTGLDAYESGNFCAIGYCPEKSEYQNKQLLLSLISSFACINDKYARYALNKWYDVSNVRMKPYRIPIKSLKNFALTEDGDTHYISYNDIYISLEDSKKTYTTKFFTNLAQKRNRSNYDLVSEVKEEIFRKTDFIPIYLGEIDTVGHKFGDDILSIQPFLNKVDSTIEKLYTLAIEAGYGFVVLGDHGMVPVTKKVDVLQIMASSSLHQYKDYEIFVDSTLARLWFYNSEAKVIAEKLLHNTLDSYGVLLSPDDYAARRIPFDIINNHDFKPIYGELLWCANTGVLISPDYFNPPWKQIRGMHGYLMNDSEHSFGQLIVPNYRENNVIDSLGLNEVCSILCDMLEICKPSNNNEILKRSKVETL